MHYNFTRQKIKALLQDRVFSTLWCGSFEQEVYPLLLIEMLAGGNMDVIGRYAGRLENLLSKIPIMLLLGQHLICVAVKK